jgi:AcrR family transcriptional regulator
VQRAEPTDLRIRRTRKLLQEALLQLLAEKSFQAITIRDITSRAMVNRSTFYDHFEDKYALMEHTVSEGFREQLAARLTVEAPDRMENLRALIMTLWDFFADLQGHCRHADESQKLLFETQVMNVVKERLSAWLEESSDSPVWDPRTQELLVAALSWSIYGATHYWVEKTPKEPGGELADLLMPIFHSVLDPQSIPSS